MVSIPDENDRSLKITKKFFQVGHLYAVREQREEFFILTKSLGLIERTRGKESEGKSMGRFLLES